MDKSCKNCRFCVYAHLGGKDKPYCERHSQYIENTILCSCWEMVSVPKPQTHYDEIRAMSIEELAAWLADHPLVSEYDENNPKHKAWLDWLKQEAKE